MVYVSAEGSGADVLQAMTIARVVDNDTETCEEVLGKSDVFALGKMLMGLFGAEVSIAEPCPVRAM